MDKLAFGQTRSECRKVSRRKYVPMWCSDSEPACLKQENTEFSYFELR